MSDEFEDDSSIEDEDGLLRRIPNWPSMLKYDKNLGSYRPSSVCFSDREGGTQLSITLKRLLLEAGGKIEDAIATFPHGFGVACLTAGFVRNEVSPSQIVIRQPTCEDPYHGLVVGEKSKSTRKTMAKNATILIQPSN